MSGYKGLLYFTIAVVLLFPAIVTLPAAIGSGPQFGLVLMVSYWEFVRNPLGFTQEMVRVLTCC